MLYNTPNQSYYFADGLYSPECTVTISSAQTVTKVTICTSGPSKAGQARSAPEPEPGVTLYLSAAPWWAASAGGAPGAVCPRRYERRSPPTLFRPSSSSPPSLSLFHLVVLPRGNYFYERMRCIITVITLSITTGKVPCVTQLPPTPASNDHTVIICV